MDPRPDGSAGLPAAGRLLALDWGTQRIGVAVSDETQLLARPLATLDRRPGRRFPLGRFRTLLETHAAVGTVVGLPLGEDGGETASSAAARELAALVASTGQPVAFWDERFTTARVQRARAEQGRTGRAARDDIDAAAAAAVLQGFLDARRGGATA
ncbi:MAG: Holliday junction resolvase RuvX [Gemmatimonadales bacterium]|nr:Holliday junction resolvase RuvX [Gemmatimonadales bacterium]